MAPTLLSRASIPSLPADIDASYPIARIIALIAVIIVILDLPPLFWHARNRNIGAGCLIAWLIALNFSLFTNTLIWPNDNMTVWWSGVGLCDIQIRIQAGSFMAIPGCLIAILRQLAAILDTESIRTTSVGDRCKREWAIDLVLCWGLPLWNMLALYIVQDIRYYIIGIAGCAISVDNSWPSLLLIAIEPLLLSLVDAYYAVLIITRITLYHRDFSRLLAVNNTTRSRFLRLFFLASVILFVFLPFQIYFAYRNSIGAMQPYSWSRVHAHTWNKIVGVPSFGILALDKWCPLAAGFAVFIFFGIGSDAVDVYRLWLVKLGFGKCFPGLLHPRRKGKSEGSGVWSQLSSRARNMFKRKRSEAEDEYTISRCTTVSGPSMVSRGSVAPVNPTVLGVYEK